MNVCSPITANFEITHHCNASCIFCSIKNHNDFFMFEGIDKITKIIDVFDKQNILRVNLFGGEPLLHPEINKIMKHIKSKGFHLSLITNGFLIDDEIIKYISKYVDAIGVSIHGCKEMHERIMQKDNIYNKVVANIKRLSDNNVKLGINYTVCAINYKEIKAAILSLLDKNINVRFVALNRYIENSMLPRGINDALKVTPSILEETLLDINELSRDYPHMNFKYAIHFPHCIIKKKRLKKFIGKCGFAENYCAVDSTGDLKLCSWSTTVLGNVLKKPIKEIWKDSKIISEYRSEKWMKKKCINCPDKERCMAGCKISAHIEPFESDSFLLN